MNTPVQSSTTSLSVIHKIEDCIVEKRQKPDDGAAADASAPNNAKNIFGLAFSGGGIRSATFNLGIIQALAKNDLLDKFHYLSTVSGGGYIGSWLMSWAYRKNLSCPTEGEGITQVQSILKDKCNRSPNNLPESEPEEVAWLRRYSNYLTPRKGLFSLDTLTGITYHIRNVFLSSLTVGLFVFGLMTLLAWIILTIPSYNSLRYVGFILGLLAAGFIWYILPTILQDSRSIKNKLPFLPTIIAAFTVIFSITWGIFGKKLEPDYAGNCLAWGYLVISLIAMMRASFKLNITLNYSWLLLSTTVGAVSFGALGYFTRDISIFLISDPNNPTSWEQFGITAPLICTLVSLAVAIHLGIVGRLISSEAYFWVSRVAGRMTQFSIMFAFPAIAFLLFPTFIEWSESMLSIGSAGIVYAIISRWLAASSDTGNTNNKQGNWKNLATEKFISMAPFILILLLIGFAAEGVRDKFGDDKLLWDNKLFYDYRFESKEFKDKKYLNSLESLCNRLKNDLGFECKSNSVSELNGFLIIDGISGERKEGLLKRNPYLNQLEESYKKSGSEYDLKKFNRIALETLYPDDTPKKLEDYASSPYSCQEKIILSEQRAAELIGKAYEETKLRGESYKIATNCTPDIKSYYKQNIAILESIKGKESTLLKCGAACLALALFLALFINANLFSLHCYYRNRLTNAYLGASNYGKNVIRDKNIGIHPDDAISLHKLANTKPYLLINTAVNLVGAGNDLLAWQDRMAASFVMSPKYCGYSLRESADKQSTQGNLPTNNSANGRYFQETEEFGGDGNKDPIKINLAMTISGAAGSPMGGFHTKPGVSMLLALTGVRLGWWLKNPAQPEAWKNDPDRWTSLLFAFPREMLGIANKNRDVVYLSDGGHFENLGIYELVRRRCAVIVASDAGGDPDYVFDDLANAIHKIRVDFGVEIEIDTSSLRPQPSAYINKQYSLEKECQCSSEKSNEPKYQFSPANFVTGTIKYKTSPLQGFKDMKEDGKLIYIKSSIPVSAKQKAADVLYYASSHEKFPQEPTSDQWFSEEQFEAYRKIGFLIGEEAANEISSAIK